MTAKTFIKRVLECILLAALFIIFVFPFYWTLITSVKSMWEAIQFASTVTQRFDFEGSMMEPVEKFFRAFGATQTPYFSISKTPSRLLKTAIFLRELLRGG